MGESYTTTLVGVPISFSFLTTLGVARCSNVMPVQRIKGCYTTNYNALYVLFGRTAVRMSYIVRTNHAVQYSTEARTESYR